MKNLIPTVTNMESPRTGRPVANQFVMVQEGRGALGNFRTRETFQSYQSVIAVRTVWEDGTVEIVLDREYWNYSATTSKYRNEFLKETTAETKKKIKDGTYKLDNLN